MPRRTVYSLDEGDRRLLRRLRAEAGAPDDRRIQQDTPRNYQYVKLTSTTPTDSGGVDYYPAEIYLYAYETAVWTLHGTCWVRFVNGATASTADYHDARQLGVKSVGGDTRPLFGVDALAGGAATARSLMQCRAMVTTSPSATLYLTPFRGDTVTLLDGGTDLVEYTLSGLLSLDVSGFADGNYDLWLYDNAGSLALDKTVWTNATTRATALTRVRGELYKDGDTARKYVATFRVESGQTYQGTAKWYVWNYYNRLPARLAYRNTGTVTSALSSWNLFASPGKNLEFVVGVTDDASLEYHEDVVSLNLNVKIENAAGGRGQARFDFDNASIGEVTNYFTWCDWNGTQAVRLTCCNTYPVSVFGVGYHYASVRYQSDGTNNSTYTDPRFDGWYMA